MLANVFIWFHLLNHVAAASLWQVCTRWSMEQNLVLVGGVVPSVCCSRRWSSSGNEEIIEMVVLGDACAEQFFGAWGKSEMCKPSWSIESGGERMRSKILLEFSTERMVNFSAGVGFCLLLRFGNGLPCFLSFIRIRWHLTLIRFCFTSGLLSFDLI